MLFQHERTIITGKQIQEYATGIVALGTFSLAVTYSL
jgi:hypothetical protein